MTEHHLRFEQGGSIIELRKVASALGFKSYGNTRNNHIFRDFVNELSPETVLKLINIHEGVYGFLEHPTPDMDRLQALKWKL